MVRAQSREEKQECDKSRKRWYCIFRVDFMRSRRFGFLACPEDDALLAGPRDVPLALLAIVI